MPHLQSGTCTPSPTPRMAPAPHAASRGNTILIPSHCPLVSPDAEFMDASKFPGKSRHSQNFRDCKRCLGVSQSCRFAKLWESLNEIFCHKWKGGLRVKLVTVGSFEDHFLVARFFSAQLYHGRSQPQLKPSLSPWPIPVLWFTKNSP